MKIVLSSLYRKAPASLKSSCSSVSLAKQLLCQQATGVEQKVPFKSQNHLHQGRYRTYLLTMASHFPKSSSLLPITTVSEVMDGQRADWLEMTTAVILGARVPDHQQQHMGTWKCWLLGPTPGAKTVETVDGAPWCFSQAVYVNLLNTQIQKAEIFCEIDPMRNICGSSLTSTFPKHDCPARVGNTEIPKHPDNKMTTY